MPECGSTKLLEQNSVDQVIKDPKHLKLIRMGYVCSCVSSDNIEGTRGRYIDSKTNLFDQRLNIIEKVSGVSKDAVTKNKCPWQSYNNPLWPEIAHFLSLEKIQGTENISDETENIVYEAVMFYKSIFTKIDNYVVSKEIKKREDKQKVKSAQARNQLR